MHIADLFQSSGIANKGLPTDFRFPMHRFYFVRCGWTYDPSSAHYPDSGRRSVCHSIRFWTLGTGHSYDLHFELQVPFQALHIVTSGFSVYDSDLIGKYFHYSVPAEIDFSGKQLLQFGPQSSSMAIQVSGSGPPASGALCPHWDFSEPSDP